MDGANLRVAVDLPDATGWHGAIKKSLEYCKRIQELQSPLIIPEGLRMRRRQWMEELAALRSREDRMNITFEAQKVELAQLRDACKEQTEQIAVLQGSVVELSENLSSMSKKWRIQNQ